MFELGAGGGQGDLDQQHELDVADAASVGQLITLCASKMQSQPQLLSGVLKMLTSVINGQVQSISLDNSGFSNDGMIGGEDDAHLANIDELPLDKLVPALAKIAADANQKQAQNKDPFMRSQKPSSLRADGLPKQIVSSLHDRPPSSANGRRRLSRTPGTRRMRNCVISSKPSSLKISTHARSMRPTGQRRAP